jgi:perosamine synthetase
MKMLNQMEPWIGEEEKRAVYQYMDSGGWLTEFKRTQEFERMIAEYVGSKYCSVLSNGTVTLFTALLALGIGPGNQVIVPDFTMIASANAVILTGATPVFVDIDRETLCIDLNLAEKAITPKTKAIMLVGMDGRHPDMDQAMSLARRHGLFVVEDAAQCMGSRYKGKHLGSFGDIGSFSFSSPKVITTGQGGALVTDDGALFEKIVMIKNFGRRNSGVDYHEVLGYNFKFTDLQAVIGIEQMKKLDWRVQRKKVMFALYQSELVNTPQVEFIKTDLVDTSPWFIDILVPDAQVLTRFLKDKCIGTRPFYPAIHSQPPYRVTGDFPVSDYVSVHGLWLPSSAFLSDDEIRRVCDEIRAFYGA